MNQKISGLELRAFRNDLSTREVLFALRIPWKMDDMKLRFVCPDCKSLDASLHPTVNMGRCFACRRNYNTIDLVMSQRKCGFKTAVEWLRALRDILRKPDSALMIASMSRSSKMK